MIKKEYIALIGDRVAGGDAPAQIRGKYHPEIIARYLDMVFADMIFQAYMLGAKTGDYSQVDNYLQRYVLPIEYVAETDEYFTTLTVQPIPLPDNFGIRQVSPPKDQGLSFAPLDNTSDPVWNVLEASFVSDIPGYKFEGTKLYYDEKLPKDLQYVMVKLVVGFSALGPKDEVFVPGGNNTMVFEKVCQLMLTEPPKVNEDNMVTKAV